MDGDGWTALEDFEKRVKILIDDLQGLSLKDFPQNEWPYWIDRCIRKFEGLDKPPREGLPHSSST